MKPPPDLVEEAEAAGIAVFKTPMVTMKFINAATLSLEFDFAPSNARYVALRWTRQQPGREPFHVTEVSVFATLARDQVPPLFDVPDLNIAGESAVDFSNKLGTLADPPKVASVSP